MNTNEYRNLAEQVLKNKEDILKHFKRDEVLADFGIRIIGTLQEAWELDDIPTEGLQYGDAYAVGSKSPYDYYIWTRADATHPTDYWFNFGEIAIAGPAGPQGARGPNGKDGKSTQWYYIAEGVGDVDPMTYNEGDMVLDAKGDVYRCTKHPVTPRRHWTLVTNIRGPEGAAGKPGRTGDRGKQGPQGEKGEKGDVGGFINIIGMVDSEELLPDPSILDNLTFAYLVGLSNPRELYIQVGESSDTAQWLNTGGFNAATLVTAGGENQNIWDSDVKLNRITQEHDRVVAYVQNSDGVDDWREITSWGKPDSLAMYYQDENGQGLLESPGVPTAPEHVANKAYVDDKLRDIGTNHVEIIYLTPGSRTWDSTIRNALLASAQYSKTNLKPDPKRLYAMRFSGDLSNPNGIVCYPINSTIYTGYMDYREVIILNLKYINIEPEDPTQFFYHLRITTRLDDGNISTTSYYSGLETLLPDTITERPEYFSVPNIPDDTRLVGTFLNYDTYPEFCDMILQIAYAEDESYNGLPKYLFLCRGNLVTSMKSSWWEEDQYYLVTVGWWSQEDETHLNFTIRYYGNDGTFWLDNVYTS